MPILKNVLFILMGFLFVRPPHTALSRLKRVKVIDVTILKRFKYFVAILGRDEIEDPMRLTEQNQK